MKSDLEKVMEKRAAEPGLSFAADVGDTHANGFVTGKRMPFKPATKKMPR